MRGSLRFPLTLAILAAAALPAVITTSSDDAKIRHALDRLTFGPRPGDLEQIRALGLQKWIDLQLNPKKIPENPVLLEKLEPLDTLSMNARDLIKNYPPPGVISKLAQGNGTYPTDPARRRFMELMVDEYRLEHSKDAPVREVATFLTPEQRLVLQTGKKEEKLQILGAYSGIQLDEAIAAIPRKGREQLVSAARGELRRRIERLSGGYRLIDRDLVNGKLYRAIYSNRQFAEVLADFWYNHFNVYQQKGDDRFMVTAYENQVIRPRVLGKFKDLLVATAESPAMLIYLDNFQSVADSSGRGRNNKTSKNGEKRGLNENYGRELMELHTLGVDGGYSQTDVTEVARCFTGWTVKDPAEGGAFEFDKSKHDNGEKRVLGVRIPRNGGMQDGLTVLDLLARHKSTARFISRKLAVRFVADNPPASLVDRMAKTFLKSGGDLREVMQTMLDSDEFRSEQTYGKKIKSPFEMVVSAVRALDADVESADALADRIAEAGEPLYRKQEPTGYSNSGEEWVNTAALLSRMNFGLALAANRIPGVKAPDPKILEQVASLQPATDPSLDTAKPDTVRLAGLYLGGPEFQRK
jgi:uncharacterized protein (DUF1800 family)